MQDCLGDLNDIAVHEDRITAIAARRGQSSRRGHSKRAFAAGLLAGREEARLDSVMATANDAHAALVKISRSGGEPIRRDLRMGAGCAPSDS
jgi:hypothetical protein